MRDHGRTYKVRPSVGRPEIVLLRFKPASTLTRSVPPSVEPTDNQYSWTGVPISRRHRRGRAILAS